MYPLANTTDSNRARLHCISFQYTSMHIYQAQMYIYPAQMYPLLSHATPTEPNYTKYLANIALGTYTQSRYTQ